MGCGTGYVICTGALTVFVLIAAKGVNLPARLVIVKGTEYFDGKTSRYVDYPLTDCLQMIGRAGRPGYDTEGTALVLVESSKKSFYKRFLYMPFPVESCLRERLCENLNAEIASRTVNSLHDAVGYLTWTFFARRVKANPSFYGAKSENAEDIEDFLTQVATESIVSLKNQGCIERDESDGVSPTILGRAASNFYLNHKTAKQMNFGLNQCCKMIVSEETRGAAENDQTKNRSEKGALHEFIYPRRLEEVSIAWLLFTLCCTHEFDELPVRHNEEFLNKELSETVIWGADTSALLSVDGKGSYIHAEVYADPHTKAFLLVQAYLEHANLPISDYINDTKTVMDSVPRLLAAMQFIASHECKGDHSFDLLCQLIRTKQLITNRCTLRSHPVSQLPGMNKAAFLELTDKLLTKEVGEEAIQSASLWTLRQTPRHAVAEAMQRCRKGTFKASFQTILDSLYAMPLMTLNRSNLYHEIDKTTGKSVGTLKVSFQIDRPKDHPQPDKKDFTTVFVVLGSFKHRKLLSYCEASISRHGNCSLDKELQFDWKQAIENGGEEGGRVVLRLLVDSVRGLDSEIEIKLN
jgi:hypothetical protein